MKVSRAWLQKYFEAPLPPVAAIADAFTFHAFEIEEAGEDMIDVKVLPNRAADCFSHRGIAKELSAILDTPLKSDPLREPLPAFPASKALTVHIEDPQKCSRYMGVLIRGVRIGPSPAWLKEALEAVGQRSINNVVDATNYVMMNIGQPLHAFDAAKLAPQGDILRYSIGVRAAKTGEKITTLTGDEYTLAPSNMLITDANADAPIGIAGVKGGKAAEITNATTDIIIESASFDGTTTRRAAQALKLFTEASSRFQNRPSSELAAYGMRDVLALIKEIAGGELEGVVDFYPPPVADTKEVSVSLGKINGVLGSNFSHEQVEDVFKRLSLRYIVANDVFTVTPPFERTDITIAEDLVEEVGRIIGYDQIAPVLLPAPSTVPDQQRFRGIERMKDQLVEQGFTEVSTQSFAEKGGVLLANPLDTTKPALRTSLEQNLKDALERAKRAAPLVLAPNEKPKLFEVGTVFPKEGEYLELRMTEGVPAWGDNFPTVDNLSKAKLEEYGKDYAPKRYTLGAYKPFSAYPFIVRDIAFWAPAGTNDGLTMSIIREAAGSLLIRLDLFDQFEKGGRVSYAYRLVFQSFDRTLTDEEVNGVMKNITADLAAKGYEVR